LRVVKSSAANLTEEKFCEFNEIPDMGVLVFIYVENTVE
jgi:hypothetical protein